HRTEGVAVAVTGEGLEARFLLRRRPEEGLLGGMWEFPGSRSDGESPDETARRTLREALAAPLPTGDGVGRALPAVEHAFSHLKVTYRPFLYRLKATEAFTPREQARAAPGPGAGGPARWASRGELGALPLPVAQRRILRLAEERLGEG
ncbi:MAG: NUDIX domain-containing protein, partial [bacterium]